MLKSYRWGGVVAHEILVSAQGPLVLVLRLRVWGQGLTILISTSLATSSWKLLSKKLKL